jgi:hypothetical protein
MCVELVLTATEFLDHVRHNGILAQHSAVQ